MKKIKNTEVKPKRSGLQKKTLALAQKTKYSELTKFHLRYQLLVHLMNARREQTTEQLMDLLKNNDYQGELSQQRINRALDSLLPKHEDDINVFELYYKKKAHGKPGVWGFVDYDYNPDLTTIEKNRDLSLALFLARKFLKQLLPVSSQKALDKQFNTASGNVSRTPGLQLLNNRVGVDQRSQRLNEAQYDEDILDKIYDAIARNLCISIELNASAGDEVIDSYQDKVLHVAGVVIKSPKIYLYVALPDDVGHLRKYRRLQVNLITNVSVLAKKSLIPATFNINQFIDEGFANLLIDRDDFKKYTIKILVRNSGNIIRDLRDFPLFDDQKLTLVSSLKTKKDKSLVAGLGKPEDALLEIQARLTHQIKEYIVGRGKEFVVLEPAILQQSIKRFFDDAAGVYKTIKGVKSNE